LRAVFNWGVEEKLVDGNPCTKVKTGPSGTRELILDGEQYRRMFDALDKLERARRIKSPVADAIRLIALTGCRRGEASDLRWRHVDLKRGLIVLPPHAHKAGKRTGKPREINLHTTSQALIAKQPEGSPDDLVFDQPGGADALSAAWRKVRAEAELPNGIGLHGLRHSVASHLAMSGAGAAEIMVALGHHQLSTTQRYLHFAETARQALAERAAAPALAGMAAAAGGEGEVVKLRRAK